MILYSFYSHIFTSLGICMHWGGQGVVEVVSLIQRNKMIMTKIPHQKKAWIWMQMIQPNLPNLVLSAFPIQAMGLLIPQMSSKKDQIHGSGHTRTTHSLVIMAMAMAHHQHTLPHLVTARKVFSWVSRGKTCSWMGRLVGPSPVNEIPLWGWVTPLAVVSVYMTNHDIRSGKLFIYCLVLIEACLYTAGEAEGVRSLSWVETVQCLYQANHSWLWLLL